METFLYAMLFTLIGIMGIALIGGGVIHLMYQIIKAIMMHKNNFINHKE
tara:strand:+ start:10465 stop:10611 length:147 start_codon:yes stop_codon:yes gene_type:complete